LFINFLLLPVFMAIGTGIGVFLYADQTSGFYLARFAWAMIPISLSQITNAILNSLGAEMRAMKHYFLGSIALFVAVWFLPQYIGIGALIVGMGACMTIASFLNLILIAKLTKGKGIALSVLKQCLVFAIICVPAALLGLFTHGIVSRMFPLFFDLAISGTVAMATFLILCHVCNVVRISTIRATLSR